MLLGHYPLTWQYCTPHKSPAAPDFTVIRFEPKLDDVGPALYVGRQGGSTTIFHQNCPVPVLDRQVVIVTVYMASKPPCLYVEFSKFYKNDHSLRNYYWVQFLVQVVGIVPGPVRRFTHTCAGKWVVWRSLRV